MIIRVTHFSGKQVWKRSEEKSSGRVEQRVFARDDSTKLSYSGMTGFPSRTGLKNVTSLFRN